MIAALLDEADRVVDQARTPLDLPERQQAMHERDVERRGEQLVAGVVELAQTGPYRLDAAAASPRRIASSPLTPRPTAR